MINEFLTSWDYAYFILVLLGVLAAIIVLSFLGKKILSSKFSLGKDDKDANLKLVNSLMIDAKRRCVVVQYGDKKHLLLLGPNNDILISTGDVSTRMRDKNIYKDNVSAPVAETAPPSFSKMVNRG